MGEILHKIREGQIHYNEEANEEEKKGEEFDEQLNSYRFMQEFE